VGGVFFFFFFFMGKKIYFSVSLKETK